MMVFGDGDFDRKVRNEGVAFINGISIPISREMRFAPLLSPLPSLL